MAAENIVPNAIVESRVVNAWIRKEIPLYLRKRWVLNELQKRGQIVRQKGGKLIEWRPAFKRRTMRASDVNPTNISFPQVNRERKAILPWRHGDIGESTNLFDELVEQGEHAFFQNAESRIKRLTADAMESLCDWLYLDGTTATAKHWHGLESIFSVSGLVSGSPVGNPNGTYAQLSQALQYYGGSWSGNWPDGKGSPQYCAWSTIYTDWANTDFGTGTSLWKDNWQEAVNYTLTFQEILARQKPDVLLLAPNLHRQIKDSLIGTQTLELTNSKNGIDVGADPKAFGIKFVSEYGVPDDTCYGLCIPEMEIKYLSRPGTPDQLVFQEEDKDISSSQKLLALHTFSNCVFLRPSAQSKIGAITTPGT